MLIMVTLQEQYAAELQAETVLQNNTEAVCAAQQVIIPFCKQHERCCQNHEQSCQPTAKLQSPLITSLLTSHLRRMMGLTAMSA